jgi:hypothetical protein
MFAKTIQGTFGDNPRLYILKAPQKKQPIYGVSNGN